MDKLRVRTSWWFVRLLQPKKYWRVKRTVRLIFVFSRKSNSLMDRPRPYPDFSLQSETHLVILTDSPLLSVEPLINAIFFPPQKECPSESETASLQPLGSWLLENEFSLTSAVSPSDQLTIQSITKVNYVLINERILRRKNDRGRRKPIVQLLKEEVNEQGLTPPLALGMRLPT